MKKALAKIADYQQNPVLFVLTYAYVMADKVLRSIFQPDFKPKRLYF